MDECKSPKAYSPPLSLPFPRKKIEEKRHAGGELFATISRRGRLPESIVRRYFQQLVFALRFYHRSGVAHYDLKPQNLLLDDEGNLKVSDRSKADVWSCGLILYVFLAGYFPFDDTNIPAMYKKISQRDYQFPDWISKPARYVIYKLLDLDPETRMDLEALFRNPWFKKSLNLTRLFETTSDGGSRREKRFTSSARVEVVEEKLKEVGGVLGFKVEAGKAINGVRGGRRRQCGSDLSGMARTVQ